MAMFVVQIARKALLQKGIQKLFDRSDVMGFIPGRMADIAGEIHV